MSRCKAAMLALALAFAAAGGAPAAENPQAAEREAMAVKLSQKAADAARRRNHQRALELHELAVKARMAMDDSAGAALELHNAAADLLRLSRLEEAEAKLSLAQDIYEEEKKLGMGRDEARPMRAAMARAALLRAVILAGKGDSAGAGQWAGLAMGHCKKADCAFSGRIFNLQARAALMAKDYRKAAAAAAEGLQASRKEEDGAETANATRVLAQAAEAEGDLKKAYAEYRKALELDREMKLGHKIAMDLLGLARVSSSSGAAERARIFAKKAAAVAGAAGYSAGAKEASALASQLAGK